MALHDPHPYERPDGSAESEGPRPQGTFGRYLLFKRLRKDALGEVYRAGQMGADAVERVVLLRIFNGSEVDGPSFRQACEERSAVSAALRGGPFGEVVDAGCEGGIAYVAYEFVFGRSLSELLEQSRESSYPVPLEHTLHIMDRIAIALQNAYEVRLDDKRILHGFLLPDFVHLSSEGEIQLTGFEVSPGLLALPAAGTARASVAGYVSPEVNAGQAPEASDDIYSMGAIFGELLTGEPLPALDPTGTSRWVEAARLAAEAEPLPDDVRHLLRESLLPRAQRIRSAEKWHRALAAITNASELTPTTFNLAFFMHTLFGDELEREAQVVEAERHAEIPRTPPPAPTPVESTPPEPQPETEPKPTPAPKLEPAPEPAPEPARAVESEAAPVPEPPAPPAVERAEVLALTEPEVSEPTPELESDDSESDDPAGGSSLRIPSLEAEPPSRPSTTASRVQSAASSGPDRKIIGLAAAAVLIVGGGVTALLLDLPIPGLGPDTEPLRVTAAPRLGADSPLPADGELEMIDDLGSVVPPLSPEEIEDQVRSLVAKRAGALEANLKEEYDERLVELRKQLETARQATSAEQEEPAVESPRAAAVEEIRPEPVKRAAPERVATAPAEIDQEPERRRPTQPTPVARPPATQPADSTPSTPVAREPLREPAPTQSEPKEATPASPQPAEPQVAAETVSRVEEGAIVQQGPGVTAPRLVQQPRVVYPPAAKRLRRQATVKVRALIDETGTPIEFEQVGKTIGLGFDQAALKAAQTTRWTPPSKDGVAVKMWVELSIDFRP